MRFSLVVVAQRHRRNLDFGLKNCSAYGDLAILWEETKWTNLTKKHSIKENKVSIWNFFVQKKYFKKQIFVLKSWSFKDIASFTIYKLKECLPYPFNSSMSNFLKFGMFSWDLYAKIYVLWSRGPKKMFVGFGFSEVQQTRPKTLARWGLKTLILRLRLLFDRKLSVLMYICNVLSVIFWHKPFDLNLIMHSNTAPSTGSR